MESAKDSTQTRLSLFMQVFLCNQFVKLVFHIHCERYSGMITGEIVRLVRRIAWLSRLIFREPQSACKDGFTLIDFFQKEAHSCLVLGLGFTLKVFQVLDTSLGLVE